MKKFSVFFIAPIFATCLAACGKKVTESFNITWLNHDGTVLKVDRVKKGSVPQYIYEKPSKKPTKELEYHFDGWYPNLTPAKEDTTYTAKFYESIRKYKVSFYNDAEKTQLLDTLYLEYWDMPYYPNTPPTKPKDAQYTYTFTGWNRTFDHVESDQEYIAQYSNSLNKYKIVWKNYDGTPLETDNEVEYGTTPTYDGATPTKPAIPHHTYNFSGWSPTVTPVNSDATYIAQFEDLIEQITITATAESGGSVEGAGTFDYGKTCTLKATSNPGYTFIGWYENDTKIEGAEATYAFEAVTTRNLTAKFKQEKYGVTLVVEPTEGGSATISKTSDLTYGEQIDLTATPNDGYAFLGFYDGDTKLSDSLSYKYTVVGNKQLKAKFVLKNSTFETCDWSYLSDACNALEQGGTEAEFFAKFTVKGKTATTLNDFVGATKTVTINNQNHIVRVIGTNHDKDTNDKALTLTFEFVNLISDENGNSLAYEWNNTTSSTSSNYDYINSSIRYALTGSGNNTGRSTTILVAQKGATTWCSDAKYKDVKIIDLLPADFKSILKDTKKSVGIHNDKGVYEEKTYNDKLFMLSATEIGFTNSADKGFGTTYNFYKDITIETQLTRMKKQVNNSETFVDDTVVIPSGSGQAMAIDVKNRAGWNAAIDNTGGGMYWTRSPSANTAKDAFYCMPTGYVDTMETYSNAIGLAPAFCI